MQDHGRNKPVLPWNRRWKKDEVESAVERRQQ